MKCVDFFCGAGGLTRGLLDAGIAVVAGIDLDGRCRKTYEWNNRPARFYERDVRTLTAGEVRGMAGNIPSKELILAGCAPCQPFSKQRKSTCPSRDATLLLAFADIIAELKPTFVLVENVPGLAKVKGYSAYRRFLHTLEKNGYGWSEGVLDAKHYGVPQTRRRYILLGGRHRTPSLPERLNGSAATPFRTVRDAIAHYPPINAGTQHSSVANHEAASVSEKNLLRLRKTPRDGGDRRDWPDELVLECHRGSYTGHTDVYGRMAWDCPAPALTGKCHSISNGRYGHPVQDRAISLREAASLQTFRDDYVFFGPLQSVAQWIGNAVPVRLAEVLGTHLLNCRAL